MAATATGVSLQEYLRTTYHPDVEYINGHLKEKPMPTLLHGFVQMLLGSWFLNHGKEWQIIVAAETRTQVDENHVRLPDVVVVPKGEAMQSALLHPPLIAIEILSSSDSYADLRTRAADLRAMGVQNVWLIDPQRRSAEIWNGKSWQPFEENRLVAVNSPAYLDTDWLWTKLDEE